MQLKANDFIGKPKLVPYRDFGAKYYYAFIDQVYAYMREEVPDKYHPDVLTYLQKYVYKIDDALKCLPTLEDALDKGEISEEAYDYYRSLAVDKKTFKPFSRK